MGCQPTSGPYLGWTSGSIWLFPEIEGLSCGAPSKNSPTDFLGVCIGPLIFENFHIGILLERLLKS